jgi:hypothetical protein
MSNITPFQSYLARMDACCEARSWAAGRTAQQAWAECERPDWLLWWARAAKVDRRLLVRAACACARTVLQYAPAGEQRPLRAIETAEAWCDGNATIEQVRSAADAASAAAYATAAASAAYAAYATDAASAAAYAADAAAYAADAAAYAAAYAAARREMCRLIRVAIPFDALRYKEAA